MKASTLGVLLLLGLFLPDEILCQGKFVDVDGTNIWVNTIATGTRQFGQPLIVFESGHGTPMGHWNSVIEEVAKFAPVVTYDRPGVGESEEDNEMPTLKNVSDKLVRLLSILKLPPPYILVGHSLGGVYVRGFANSYPEQLAGLIIIDPADFTETLDDRQAYYAGLGLSQIKIDSLIESFVQKRVSRNAESPKGIGEEGSVLEEMRADNFRELNSVPVPNIPIHMLIGGRFDMPEKLRSKEYDDEMLFRNKEAQRIRRYITFVNSVEKGMLFYSGDAGHFVHYDDPQLLISSIQIMLKDIQSPGSN